MRIPSIWSPQQNREKSKEIITKQANNEYVMMIINLESGYLQFGVSQGDNAGGSPPSGPSRRAIVAAFAATAPHPSPSLLSFSMGWTLGERDKADFCG